jgi:hypothetical protein
MEGGGDVIIMVSLYCVPFQVLNQLLDFQDICYEDHSIEGQSDLVLNLL